MISGGIPFTCKTELNQVVTMIMKDFVNASQIVEKKTIMIMNRIAPYIITKKWLY